MGCTPEASKREAKPGKPRKLDLPPGIPPLTSLYMYISGSCNLACRHCWINPTFEPDNSKGQYLKFEHIQKSVFEAKPLGLHSVKLTGGEPMLHPEFEKIVQYLDGENVRVTIETNGTLIDKKLARFLKKNPYIRFISVSLDGAFSSTHDAFRGSTGSYDRAITGISNLVEAGIKPQLICTLHRNNLDELEKVIALAADLGCNSIKFNHIQRIGRGDVLSQENVLSNDKLLGISNLIESEIRPHHRIKIFFDIPIAFQSIRQLIRDPICQCNVLNLLGVLASGHLSLCGVGATIPELIYGDLEKDQLKDVWVNAPGLLDLRKAIPFQLEGICGECIHREICLGQCIARNYHDARSLCAPFYFCSEMENLGLFPKSRKNLVREA